MENIDLSDNVKLEESCVIVDDNLLYEVARRNRKLRSYKVIPLSQKLCDYLCFVCICTKHTCGLAAVGLCVCGECVWGYAYMLHVNGMCEKNLFAVMQLIFF